MLAEVLALLQRETGELGEGNRIGAGRKNLPLSISLQYRMCVSNPSSMKSFHGVLAGNVHEYLLKSSIGKAG
jgi:hypothetical protein